MAYQTLPNTFVSGSTIYSTAVSANMVALLQGYTTGSYDLWGRIIDGEEIDINSGTAGIGSAGTSTLGNTTVQTFTGESAATFASAVGVTLTLTVGGDASITGNVTAAAGDLSGNVTIGGNCDVTGSATVGGALQVSGNVYTTAWTDVGATAAAVTGYDNGSTCINSYRYMRLGNTINVSLNFGGTSTATTLSFNLPVTAGTNQIDMNFVGTGQDNNTTLPNSVPIVYTTGNTLRVDAYSTPDLNSWTSSNNKAVVAQFSYEVD